jgi:hypothetical protein
VYDKDKKTVNYGMMLYLLAAFRGSRFPKEWLTDVRF